MPEEVAPTYPHVELEGLSQEMLIDIVENMALRFSEEVEAEPGDLISDSYQHAKDNASKFQFDVDRGHCGYSGKYRTLEEGMKGLNAYIESFPSQQLFIKITPINNV